jgi:hypothetical protein
VPDCGSLYGGGSGCGGDLDVCRFGSLGDAIESGGGWRALLLLGGNPLRRRVGFAPMLPRRRVSGSVVASYSSGDGRLDVLVVSGVEHLPVKTVLRL